MKESSRRQVLQGIAGASILPALNLLSPPTGSGAGTGVKKELDTPVHTQTLAVVFHGLFAFLFGDPGGPIQVLVPVVSGHRYWAGNFGQEDEHKLREGETLDLSGVTAGTWPKNYDFPYLKNFKPPDDSKVYCEITIPWPDDLKFDREVVPITGQIFFTSPASLTPTRVPAIYAFLYYDSRIASRPALTGTTWKGPRTMGQAGKSVNANLHIRAEHCGISSTNGWDVFNDLFGLTGNDRLVWNGNYVNVGAAKGIGTTIPPGEDNFLSDEDQCAKAANKMPSGSNKADFFNSPTNCASIGGCRPTKDRSVCS